MHGEDAIIYLIILSMRLTEDFTLRFTELGNIAF